MTTAEGIVGEYLALKGETDADLLAMQCGDFYEFFAEDAELVSEELDLKVSQKSSHGSSYPMAGVPLTELTPYLKALIERGYRVAVADQHEVDGGHERRIERIVTPGTLLEATEAAARYLAAVVREPGADEATGNTGSAGTPVAAGSDTGSADGAGGASDAGGTDGVDGVTYGLAFADVTTGRFHATAVAGREAALTEIYRFAPVEVLPGPEIRADDALLDALGEDEGALSLHATDAFAPGRARHAVEEQFGTGALESVGLDDASEAVRAAGAVLSYVEETGVGVRESMTRLRPARGDESVALDATTQRNLELAEPMGEGGTSLLETIDHTVTSAGGRLLRERLTRPQRSVAALDRRLDCVTALAERALARERLRELLAEAADAERLASAATAGSADARDLLRARDTLALLPRIADAITDEKRLAASPLAEIVERPDRAAAERLHGELDAALVEEPPKTVREGGLFRRGYDTTLDELIDEHETALEWIEGLQAREKRTHGITHLSTGRNRTDGYYIQVGKSETDAVPESYEEIKTLKNAKRYTTAELEERERMVLKLEERRGELEYELFADLRERVAGEAALLQDVGRALAAVDVHAALSTHASKHDWTRPAFGDSGLDVEAGRHPVVERTTEFVPNDARLDDERSFLVVTGPNMSGKSTYLRGTALIALLAQIGSFVPAREAEIEPVDGIYTRVGALDELAGGRSTFMVEMAELANILHSATAESLVVLDEVGRGTATYDGISIAWAATEYLHNEVRAKAMFATHYHELAGLAERLERVRNVHVAAEERDGEVTFLRTVREGPADRSYGVYVADLAGVPDPVVARSRDVLERLRAEEAIEAKGSGGESVQAVFDLGAGEFRTDAECAGASGNTAAADGGEGSVGDAPTDADAPRLDPETETVLDELAGTDLDETPPIELLSRVQEWQSRLGEEP
ncbi:DNA mismatch repair protein MutS [Halobacteriales archaeon QS_4_69_34]|nr:MAG: DNA mismatch repair protein MutS [Halobacteriales archaeon QS_4_69_34]